MVKYGAHGLSIGDGKMSFRLVKVIIIIKEYCPQQNRKRHLCLKIKNTSACRRQVGAALWGVMPYEGALISRLTIGAHSNLSITESELMLTILQKKLV